MAKYLTLLRHGEAEYAYGQSGDFERKLTDQGKHKLERLCTVLKNRGLDYDLMLKSPAQRTEETAEILLDAVVVKKQIANKDLYLGTSTTIMEIIGDLSDDYHQVILVGHNPWISSVLGNITNDYQISLSPGMMAVIEIHADSWRVGANRGLGTLVEILQ